MNVTNSNYFLPKLNLRKDSDFSVTGKTNFCSSLSKSFISSMQDVDFTFSRNQVKELINAEKEKYDINIVMNGDFLSKEQIMKKKTEISKIFFDQKSVKENLGYDNFRDLKNINIMKSIEKMKSFQKIEFIKNKSRHSEADISYLVSREENKFIRKIKNLGVLEKIYKSVSEEIKDSNIFFYGLLDESVSRMYRIGNILMPGPNDFDFDFFSSRLRYMVSIEEIKEISRNNVDKKQNIGYLYFQQSSGHFDTLLIDSHGDVSNLVICELRPAKNIYKLDINSFIGLPRDYSVPDLYRTDITWLVQNYELTVFPQESDQHCGSIGIKYLREILQDDILEDYSLKIKIPWGSTERKFFVVPPQALAHVQCSTYAEILYHFVNCEDDMFEIPYKSVILEVRTLQSLLDDGAKIQRRPNFDLKKFRFDYTQAYESVMAEKDKF